MIPRRYFIWLILMLVCAPSPLPAMAETAAFSLGVNLDANADYSTDACWVNLFHRFSGSGDQKTNRGWGRPAKPWEPDPNLKLTPDGYPLSDAGTFTYGRGYPDGVYKFSMRGSGTPAFWGKAKIMPGALRTIDGVTTADVSIAASQGSMIMFRLTGIDPANPPSDLRLIVPGLPADTDRVYTDLFLQKLSPFSTVREMDRGRTNHSDLSEWDGRVRPDEFCQTSTRGVAYEYMIALANESRKDLWICVPDLATDEYVTQMARLFAAKLNPHCNLYVEYSNEWWNASFRQNARGREAAKVNPELIAADPSERVCQQLGFEAVRIGRIFRNAFGERAGQIRPVLAGHTANPWWSEMALKFIANKYGPPANELYALAATTYFGLWEGDASRPGGVDVEGMTLDDYFADLGRAVAKPRTKTQRHRELAQKYNLRLIAYEGGFHITDWNGGLKKNINSKTKELAMSDARMTALTPKIFDAWRRDAGEPTLVMWFNFCSPGGKFGRWGLLERIDQDDSLKYKAAVEYLKSER